MVDPKDAALMVELGRRLAEVRSAAKLTQTDLAKAAGVTKSTVGRLEAGDGSNLLSLVRCLRVLDLTDGLAKLIPQSAGPSRTRIGGLALKTERGLAVPRPSPWVWDDN